MKTIFGIVAFVGLLTGMPHPASAQIQILNHDEDMASIRAEEFARTAFIQHNYQRAYVLFSSKQKQRLTEVQFTESIVKMHNAKFPSGVFATEFEPIPGQKAMNIYLQGKNEKDDFYYRFVMEGTEETGYSVAGFFRGNGPYPNSPMRMPLKKKNNKDKTQ